VDIIIENLPYFIRGLLNTIIYSLVTLFISSIAALSIAAIYNIFQNKVLRRAIILLINIIRGLPLLVVLFAVYYILPFFNFDLPRVLAAIFGLSVFFSASLFEVVRGAIQSVPGIQINCAKALGLSRRQTLQHIIFPQAMKLILSPWIGEFVRIVKGTTLLAFLSISELMLVAKEVTTATFKGIEIYTVVALLYFLFIYTCSRFGHWVEKKFSFYY